MAQITRDRGRTLKSRTTSTIYQLSIWLAGQSKWIDDRAALLFRWCAVGLILFGQTVRKCEVIIQICQPLNWQVICLTQRQHVLLFADQTLESPFWADIKRLGKYSSRTALKKGLR